MDKDILFKKAAFGGFDKEDVMNYIAKITDEFQTYKSQTIGIIDKLREKADELERENNELREKCNELSSEVERIQVESEEKPTQNTASADEIKDIIESLYENINGFMSAFSAGDDKEQNTEASDASQETDLEDEELLKIIDKYVD